MPKTRMERLEESFIIKQRQTGFNYMPDSVEMMLLIWMAGTLDKCDEIGDGIGPLIMKDLCKELDVNCGGLL